MSDIVERLRAALFDPYGKEAADEITSLRARLAEVEGDRLREALKGLLPILDAVHDRVPLRWRHLEHIEKAKALAALEHQS